MRRDADAAVAPAGGAVHLALEELRLQNVRCLRSAELALHPRVNLITGDNGAGKTSLLEAIYLLGRGRSFRTRRVEQLVRSGESRLAVTGAIRPHPHEGAAALLPLARATRVSVQCELEVGLEARLDERAVESMAELAALFPVQVIDPGIHRLIEEGPAVRRQWLDWALFHVEPEFLAQWRGYRRALRQRNAALRTGGNAALWDGQLQRFGEALTAARARLVELLRPAWTETLHALDAATLIQPPPTLAFYRGWRGTQSLAECLTQQGERDRERGMTTQGPHQFDVGLRVQGVPVRDTVSRGQQKLLGAAMALSMARLLTEQLGQAPALLLDDPAAELDPTRTRLLLAAAGALGGQQIVTALRLDQTHAITPDGVFHVERGGVKRL